MKTIKCWTCYVNCRITVCSTRWSSSAEKDAYIAFKWFAQFQKMLLVKSVSRVTAGINNCASINLEVTSSDALLMGEKSWSQGEDISRRGWQCWRSSPELCSKYVWLQFSWNCLTYQFTLTSTKIWGKGFQFFWKHSYILCVKLGDK